VPADNESLELRLKDGRTLCYAIYGDPGGRPAFYFHGHPGSRLEGRFADEPARRHSIKLIAPDRPGYGRSSDKPRRRITDWPADVAELGDALGDREFFVIGGSGGGPFSLACASLLPNRVIAAGLVSAVAPYGAPGATDGMRPLNKIAFKYISRLPVLPGLIMKSMARKIRRDPDGAFEQIKSAMSPPDREVLERPMVGEDFKEIVAEAFRNGASGATAELRLLGRPWGFRLSDIKVPVHLWQGTEDRLVPEAMGRYLAAAIPGCRATFVEGQGHLLFLDRIEEIIQALGQS